MRHNFLWIVMLLMAVSCLDDKNNYNYKDINTVGDSKITGLRSVYTCFPGEEVHLVPEVKLSKDTLNPDVSYSWYVNGALTEHTEPTYTFKSDVIATHKIVFCVTDNQTGVQFVAGTQVSVDSRWLKGWMILSKGAGDASQVSMVLMRRSEVALPENQTKDTIYYDGQDINIVKDLGTGPKKLRESFMIYDYGFDGAMDEIVVLQDNKCAELHGSDLHKVINTEEEFSGAVPSNFRPLDAIMTTGLKCVLDQNGYVYTSTGAVITDFHAGRYPSEPAFNGRKFKALYQSNRNNAKFFLALDQNNTLVGIVDDATARYGSQDVQMGGKAGALAEIRFPESSYDKTLFQKIPEEVLFTTWTDGEYEDPSFVSLLKGQSDYYMHTYSFEYKSNPSSEEPNLDVTSTNGRTHKISSAMMDNFTDAAALYYYKCLIVANGNKLYSCSLTDENDPGKEFMTFAGNIVAIDAKDMGRDADSPRYDFGGAHVGVALDNGEFYIYELKYDEDAAKVTEMRELYHYAGFGSIVDVIYKYGESTMVTFPYQPN
ncbi:PKD-like family lipoprotein [Sanguibacteroides sp. AM78-02pH3A]|uniref:PKD-like family lipoprotein n=1 Tax=Sanguibacteroides sp. AM78-02pH3A TaxID=3002646 RepID=UPI0022E1916D|nr:PKD-like family lipoprotein [Sanguibacteroides sp. AM78-02pH3A]